jgi:hypothetical protein
VVPAGSVLELAYSCTLHDGAVGRGFVRPAEARRQQEQRARKPSSAAG